MENKKTSKLKLYFKDAQNSQRTISVDYPKESYDEKDINDAMDKILQSGILQTKKGPLATKASAEIETIEKSPFPIN